jgi:hypothetical protein
MLPMPVPAGGNLEGEDAYACEGDGDCHLIVWAPAEQKLYEMWRADNRGHALRGRLPGGLGHVARAAGHGPRPAVLERRRRRLSDRAAPVQRRRGRRGRDRARHPLHLAQRSHQRGFVPPATHGTNTTGSSTAPYYGVHLRLRADFPLERLPNDGARVVARALQRYGMYHADGGNIALTAQSDRTRSTSGPVCSAARSEHAEGGRLRGHRARGADHPDLRLRALRRTRRCACAEHAARSRQRVSVPVHVAVAVRFPPDDSSQVRAGCTG